MGAGGAVGLNFDLVDRMMERMGVALDERMEFYFKVRTITSVVLSEQHKDREAKRNKK